MATVTYQKRERGGWFATVEGHKHRVLLTETPRHMRTTNYFRWTAKQPASMHGKAGFGPTRQEAIDDLFAQTAPRTNP